MSKGEKSQSIDASPISTITPSSLPLCFLIFFFKFLFSFFLLFLSIYLLLLIPPPLVHGCLHPFYTCLNLWDFSLLFLRLYQPLFASFPNCILAYYFFVSLAFQQQIRVKGFLYLSLWHASSAPNLCLLFFGKKGHPSKAFFRKNSRQEP